MRPDVQRAELDVDQPAVERGVAVQIVGRDDREDRLDRRVRPELANRQQLVDPEVGVAVQADLAVGVGQLGRPAHQRGAVLLLGGVEEPELTAGVAGAAHVGHHVDVAALHQIAVLAGPATGDAAGRVLAVRCLGEQHRKRPRRGLSVGGRRGVDVRAQNGAVTHRDRHVLLLDDSVLGRLRRPGQRAAVEQSGARDRRQSHSEGHSPDNVLSHSRSRSRSIDLAAERPTYPCQGIGTHSYQTETLPVKFGTYSF